jgi:hypothetical protein
MEFRNTNVDKGKIYDVSSSVSLLYHFSKLTTAYYFYFRSAFCRVAIFNQSSYLDTSSDISFSTLSDTKDEPCTRFIA